MMSIDISSLLASMVESARGAVEDSGAASSSGFENVLENNRNSLQELIVARQNGDINQQDFDMELEREKQIMEVEVLSLQIMAKSAIQKAMNAAMETLRAAVAAAL